MLRRVALPAAIAGAIALTALACGRSAEPPSPTPSSACADLYSALVTYRACFDPTASAILPGRQDRFLLNCAQHLSAPGVSGAAVEATERCVTAVQAAIPKCGTVDPRACVIPAGTRDAGAPCGAAMQCASNECASDNEAAESDPSFLELGAALTTCGKCVARLPVGAPCEALLSAPSLCVTGAGCTLALDANLVAPDGGDAMGTCTASAPTPGPSGAGGPCWEGACSSTLVCTGVPWCRSDLLCVNATCITRPSPRGLTMGQTCSPQGVGPEACSDPLLCSARSNTCEPRSFIAPGGRCNGFDLVCATGACSVDVGGIGPPRGTCPAIIADGRPCAAPQVGVPVCDDYATCVNAQGLPDDAGSGTCRLLDPGSCK